MFYLFLIYYIKLLNISKLNQFLTDLDQTNSNLRKQIEDYTNIVEQSKEITVGDGLFKFIFLFFSDIFMFLFLYVSREPLWNQLNVTVMMMLMIVVMMQMFYKIKLIF
jgi:hypothetical protein